MYHSELKPVVSFRMIQGMWIGIRSTLTKAFIGAIRSYFVWMYYIPQPIDQRVQNQYAQCRR